MPGASSGKQRVAAMSTTDGRDYVFSDLTDTVTQRTIKQLERHRTSGSLGEWYARRINFDAFLGFRHLWTDPAVLDGQAFHSLLSKDANGVCWYDRLLFATPDQPPIRVAATHKTLEETLVARIRSRSGKLTGFAFSLIDDDAERERVRQHLPTIENEHVKDFDSLLAVLKHEAEYETIAKAEEHWKTCREWEHQGKLQIVQQNMADEQEQQFAIRNGFAVFGIGWMELRERWHELWRSHGTLIGRPMEPEALELLTTTHVHGFARSWFDGHWTQQMDAALALDSDRGRRIVEDLAALRTYFYRAYNAEIARCNGVAYDLNQPLGVFDLDQDHTAMGRVVEEHELRAGDTVIQTPEDLFAKITDLPSADVDAVLAKNDYPQWLHHEDRATLERTIDALFKRVDRKPSNLPKWIDPYARRIVRKYLPTAAGTAAGIGSMYLVDQTVPPQFPPDHDPFDKPVEIAAQTYEPICPATR